MLRAIRWALVALCFGGACAQAAVQHIVDANGKLLGATGVEIDGALYNLEFVDGTCAEVFGNCDWNNEEHYTFLQLGDGASLAIFDQVLTGVFDTVPSLTNGCDKSTWEGSNYCLIHLPVGVGAFEKGGCEVGCDVYPQGLLNSPAVGWCLDYTQDYEQCDDILGANSPGRAISTSGDPTETWARYSMARPVNVSEPPIIATLGLALIALIVSHRHRLSSRNPITCRCA